MFAARTSKTLFALSRRGGAAHVFRAPSIPVPRTSTPSWKVFQLGRGSGPLSGKREYHNGSGGGAGQNWDGLVYSIMNQMSLEGTYSCECFYYSDADDEGSSSATSTSSPESKKKERRDVRVDIPLKLNRPSILELASDLKLRLEYLPYGGDVDPRMRSLERLLVKLAQLDEDSPLLHLYQYAEIFATIKDAVGANFEANYTLFTHKELEDLENIRSRAEVVFRIACVNGALRGLPTYMLASADSGDLESSESSLKDAALSEKSLGSVDKSAGMFQRFTGVEEVIQTYPHDMTVIKNGIHGVLFDSKDWFPTGRWFSREQEKQILEIIKRMDMEVRRRGH